MWEHKAIAAPVRIGELHDRRAGVLEIVNHQAFRDLGWLRARWELAIDGRVTASGEATLEDVGPGERGAAVLVGWIDPSIEPRRRGLAHRPLRDRRGRILGTGRVRGLLPPSSPSGARPTQPRRARTPSRPGARRSRSMPTGCSSTRRSPPRRRCRSGARRPRTTGSAGSRGRGSTGASTGSSGGSSGSSATARPRSSGASTRRRPGSSSRTSRRSARWPEAGSPSTRSRSCPTSWPTCPGRDGPRAPPGLEQVAWFGTGPHETYPDRRRSGLVGRWQSTVTEQHVPYIRPQESGGHADVRWLELDRGRRPRRTDPVRPAAPGLGDPLPSGRPDRGDPRRRAHPATRDGRPPRRRPPRARDGELRPGHAAGVPRRAGDPSLVVDARPGRGRLSVPIDWDPGLRQLHLRNDRISYVVRVLENGALGGLFFGPALTSGRSYEHLGLGPFHGFSNRVGDPVALEYPTAGIGDFRVPALTIEGPDGSTVARPALRRPPDRPGQAGPPGAAVDVRRSRRRGRHGRDRPRRRADWSRRHAALHDLPRSARRRRGARRSATVARPRSG